jgi:hypothetical protein
MDARSDESTYNIQYDDMISHSNNHKDCSFGLYKGRIEKIGYVLSFSMRWLYAIIITL